MNNEFKNEIKRLSQEINIELQDERMTSISAHKTLYEMNVSSKKHKESWTK